MKPRLVACSAVLLALAVACDEVEPASRLERPRILAVRAVVEPTTTGGSPSSSPRPGERFRVETTSVSAEREREAFASLSFVACPTDDEFAALHCTGPRLPPASGTDVSFVAPTGGPSTLLLFGMACVDGVASVEATALTGSCSRGIGQEISLRVDVGQEVNLHPDLRPGAVVFDGAPMDEGGGCDDRPRLVRADGATHRIVVSGDRLGIEDGEEPLLTHVATHGELDGLYSIREADLGFRVGWKAPSTLSAPRTTARFHFVLRDGRGGLATHVARVCLEQGGS